MAKKAKKKKRTRLKKAKKLTYEEELALEKEVVSKLATLERAYDDRAQSSVKVRALIRAYRRKHLEAQELREYLIVLKNYFEKGWDEEEGYFYGEDSRNDTFVPGHWCPNLIEEIGEMTEEGIVYSPLPIKVV